MKIAHITSAHPLTDNRIRQKECASLAAYGFSVSIIGAGKPNEVRLETHDGVEEIRTVLQFSRLKRMTVGVFNIGRELWNMRPDLVHAHDPELIPLLIAYKFARPRVKTIYDAHEDLVAQVTSKSYIHPLFRSSVGRAAALLEQAAARFTDAIVAATPHIADRFRDAKRVVLVQNFPLLTDFPRVSETAGQLNLAYVGALTKIRGSDQLVRAMDQVPEAVSLKVVGPAPIEVQEELQASRGNIEYLGVVGVKEVPDFLRSCFAGIVLFQPHPNHSESQPTKLFEYMASGIPFIASNFRHWEELVGNTECGIFVDPVKPEDVANAIIRLAADRDLSSRMGRAGRELMMSKYSFEAEQVKLHALVSELLGTPNSSACVAESGFHEGN